MYSSPTSNLGSQVTEVVVFPNHLHTNNEQEQLETHKNSLFPQKKTYFLHAKKNLYQGTIGCTPNSVPMVFIVFFRD